MTAEQLNQISGQIVDAAIEVHVQLGPGLLESGYQACLSHELQVRGYTVRCQVPLPRIYKAVKLDVGYRLDMLVEDAVVVETKSVDRLLPVHEAQLLSYLRLSRKRVGLLLNFKTARMREGIKRMVNGL